MVMMVATKRNENLEDKSNGSEDTDVKEFHISSETQHMYADLGDKVREMRLKRLGRVRIKDEEYVGKRMLKVDHLTVRKRGSLKVYGCSKRRYACNGCDQERRR